MSSRKEGFTLLELLLVILIVALLAAVLFPVFAQARREARQRTCLNSLRVLAAATLMYAHDWDGCAPGVQHLWADGGWAGAWPVNQYTLWQVMISPYLPSRKFFNCPNAFKVYEPYYDGSIWRLNGVPIPQDWAGVQFSYGMNTLLQLSTKVPTAATFDSGQLTYLDNQASDTFPNTWFNYANMAQGPGVGMPPSTGWGGRNLARLTKPNRVVLISDAPDPDEDCYEKLNVTELCGYEREGCTLSGVTLADTRHNGGNNWAAADGSARWVRADWFTCVMPNNNYPDAAWTLPDADIRGSRTLQLVHGVDQLN